MNVLLLNPSFPVEIAHFTAGLAKVGARVFGVGEHPEEALQPHARQALTAYLRVPSLFDEQDCLRRVVEEVRSRGLRLDRVESLWEPTMLLAARLREALDVPGMDVAGTLPYRDKEVMKRVLDEAGIRTPRHASASTEDEVRAAAAAIGYPLIVKPIAGAGSAHTHRCDDDEGLEAALLDCRGVPEVSVEEFIDGEEFTFDTICARGQVLYYNICAYRPRPLQSRQNEWISPQTVALKDPDADYLQGGVRMGLQVLEALDFRDGFTHMEWYRKADGEVVFGEIGARPPGARTVDIMNYSCDADFYTGWAHAVCHGSLGFEFERRHNAASVVKRALGQGRIRRIDGLGSYLQRFGEHVVSVDLLPVGAQRRDWKATLMSDGHIVVRHPELSRCLEMADRIGTDIQMFAS